MARSALDFFGQKTNKLLTGTIRVTFDDEYDTAYLKQLAKSFKPAAERYLGGTVKEVYVLRATTTPNDSTDQSIDFEYTGSIEV